MTPDPVELLATVKEAGWPTARTLVDFGQKALQVIGGLSWVPVTTANWTHYVIFTNGTKRSRPVNSDLFAKTVKEYDALVEQVRRFYLRLRPGIDPRTMKFTNEVTRFVYTTQQCLGVLCDLFMQSPNAAKKLCGQRFEELVSVMVRRTSLETASLRFALHDEESDVSYSSQIDLVVAARGTVLRSSSTQLVDNECLVSIKTSSKDRMPKIFSDKLLLEHYSGKDLMLSAVFLNDVQRKGKDGATTTFVANLFLIYHKHLTQLTGVYYVDIPARAQSEPWNRIVSPFEAFLCDLNERLEPLVAR